MATKVITAKQFPGIIQKRLKADVALLQRAALGAVKHGEAQAVILTTQRGLVDRGTFRRGWESGRTEDGAYLRNDAPYSGTIEHGRRPGAPGPPFEPILEWVERKLVGNGELEPEEAYHVAWAIRNAIHHNGTPPSFILRDVTDLIAGYFRAEAMRLLKRKK